MQAASYDGKFLKQSEDWPRRRSRKSQNLNSVVKETMCSDEEKRRKTALPDGLAEGD